MQLPSAGLPYAGKIKTPAGHASRGFKIGIITQERHIKAFPAREG